MFGWLRAPAAPGLLFEAAETLGVTGDVLGQDLDRHLAAEAGVASAVDLTHAPGPEQAEDLVGTKMVAP